MSDQFILVIAAIAIIILLIFIQIYLSTRSSFIWGLIMPIIFLLLWQYIAFDIGQTVIDITSNQLSITLISWFGVIGMLVSLLILLICRRRIVKNADYRDNRNAEEVFAKQQKQAAMSALNENNDANAYFAAKEYQKMLIAKEAALQLSIQREQKILAKQQAKIKDNQEKSPQKATETKENS